MRRIIIPVVLLLSSLLSPALWAVTLKAVVEDVLYHHPRLLSAKANTLIDQYGLKAARGDFLPRLNLRVARGTEISENTVTRAALAGGKVQYVRQENGLIFSQMIFDGFNAHSRVNEQRFNLKSAEYNLRSIRQSLIREIAEAYLNVLRSRELIILARNNIAVHKKILNEITVRYKGGAGTLGEIELAESRLALAKVGLATALGRLEEANANYFSLVTKPAPLIMRKPKSMRRWVPKSKKEAVKMGMYFNPDIHIFQADMASSNEAVQKAKSSMFPRLDLQVNATDNFNLDGLAGRNYDFTALLVMNYALYNGGQDLAALNQARSRRLQSLHDMNSTRRDVLRLVTTAWANWRENVSLYHDYRDYVVKQKKVVIDYKQQFNLGKRALFNVLDAENELFRARVGVAESYYSARIDTFRLLARIGVLTPKIL